MEIPDTNIEDPEFRTRMMHKVIKAVKEPGNLHMPLLALVSCFIDGLARPPKGKVKQEYTKYLSEHFPDLCAELEAEVFYENFRCKSVHEFSIKQGFGIARNSEMNGKYVDTKNGKSYPNIDRLVDDFLDHVEKIKP